MSSSMDANEMQFRQIFQTLQSKPQGYIGTAEFLYDLFNAHTVDGEITAKRNGFKTFPQFLKSDSMKKYVELGSTSDGRTVYKARQVSRSEHTSCVSAKSTKEIRNCLPSAQSNSNQSTMQRLKPKEFDKFFNADEKSQYSSETFVKRRAEGNPFTVRYDALHSGSQCTTSSNVRPKRQEISSLVTNKMGTKTTLTTDKLQNLGELIEAVVEYHFPDHVQLKNLLPSMEMVEPRFLSLEQTANISHRVFLRRYCTNVSLFGSSSNPSLLWNGNRD